MLWIKSISKKRPLSKSSLECSLWNAIKSRWRQQQQQQQTIWPWTIPQMRMQQDNRMPSLSSSAKPQHYIPHGVFTPPSTTTGSSPRHWMAENKTNKSGLIFLESNRMEPTIMDTSFLSWRDSIWLAVSWVCINCLCTAIAKAVIRYRGSKRPFSNSESEPHLPQIPKASCWRFYCRASATRIHRSLFFSSAWRKWKPVIEFPRPC